MVSHRPAKNSGPFHWMERLYGGPLTTTIDFFPPNQRVELRQCGKAWVANRLMATPNIGWGCIGFPFGNIIFCTLAKMFLGQDEWAMKRLAVGLRHGPSSMFLGDADMPAKWD